MIEHLVCGGIGFVAGFFVGIIIAALMISAKSYDVGDYEDYEDRGDD